MFTEPVGLRVMQSDDFANYELISGAELPHAHTRRHIAGPLSIIIVPDHSPPSPIPLVIIATVSVHFVNNCISHCLSMIYECDMVLIKISTNVNIPKKKVKLKLEQN